ncbi:hypothetical protein BOX15_Mlig024279g1 [Macrostomum lignano]|uniref:Reverse transcriptase domain-containing protein n=1 Tax=Macrostomum lignano TaxID=282301 RepID=A0A267FLU3_9PLAT|nr:hypothetical protein BOX15_Mlig024279g1 [Macrostomum lignano]
MPDGAKNSASTDPEMSGEPKISIALPSPFLPSPGQPPLRWENWKAMFDNYMLASGMDKLSDKRKQALLVHCLGTEGQRIYLALQQPLPDTLEATEELLEKHFATRINVVAERYRFRQRAQRPGESVADYVAALQALSTRCDFGAFKDEMLRDQLVEKTHSDKIRERLLIEEKLTLSTAVELAQQLETGMREASSLRSNPTSDSPIEVGQVKRQHHAPAKTSYKPKPRAMASAGCGKCGQASHEVGSKCPAQGQKCRACGKLNHFQRVCRSAGKVRGVNEEVTVSTVQPGDGFETHCEVKLGDTPLKLLVDTGSRVTIVSQASYNRHFSHVKLQTSTKKLTAFNGGSIHVMGEMVLPVEYKELRVPNVSIVVVKQGSNIMGTDLMSKLKFQLVSREGEPVRKVQASSLPTWLPGRFSNVGEGLGKIKGFVHKPKVNPAVTPVAQPLRKVPLSLKEPVKKEIHKLLAEGVIEEVHASEWVSNLVVVPKPNGSLRICNDLRNPNKAIVPDKHPLPTFEQLSAEFAGSKIFTKLDLNSSYLQLELAEESRNLTTFITDEGLYRYTRVCFGMNSAPAAFQKVLSKVLEKVKGVVHYIDDIVMHAVTRAEHDKAVTAVLDRLKEHNITLNLEKCQWARDSVEFLGYVVSQ